MQKDQTIKRSAGSIREKRAQQAWPKDKEFRILSIDGGGIKGIFPAVFLQKLEEKYLQGQSITSYFDMISGTSTGGIIALGLGAGMPSEEIAEIYLTEGKIIFPPSNKIIRFLKSIRSSFLYKYNKKELQNILNEKFKDKLLGNSRTRLCIPSFEGRFGEVFIFKTAHHPDFQKDYKEKMVKVALSTSAAPAYYKALNDGGYSFVDGGVWANNPVMIALVDVLTCYDIPLQNIRILSLSCGNSKFALDKRKSKGGFWQWRKIILAAMHLQSLNALGQAGLLIGPNNIIRVNPESETVIELDDWEKAKDVLPSDAEKALEVYGDNINQIFFKSKASVFNPVYKNIL